MGLASASKGFSMGHNGYLLPLLENCSVRHPFCSIKILFAAMKL